MGRSAWLVIVLVVVLGGAVGAIGCGGDPVTAVDVTIDADACFAERASRLEVHVFDADGEEQATFPADPVVFPTGVRIHAIDPERTWRITARAYDALDMPIGDLTATGGWTREMLTTHRVVFDDECYGVSCSADRVCRAGRCDRATGMELDVASTTTNCPSIVWVDDTTGMDGADCSDRTAPCKTISHTLTTHGGEPGPLVFVHGGATYTASAGGNVVTVREGGTLDLPLTIRAWPETGVPVVDGMGTHDNVIDLNAGFITVDGLELRGGSEHGISINTESVEHITIARCDIHDNGTSLLTIAMGSLDNRCGIVINNGASYTTIAECAIHDNVNPMFDVEGIRALDGRGRVVGLMIADNAIYGNKTNGLNITTMESTVVGNRIYDHDTYGIRAEGETTDIVDNVVCDAGRYGVIRIGGRRASLMHNTVIGSAQHGFHIVTPQNIELSGNLVTESGDVGVWADGELTDSHNAYFGNPEPTEGFTRSAPTTDRFDDPLFEMDAEPCTGRVDPMSPTRGAGPDGEDIGARLH